jgi:hypothetical protein
LVQLEADEEIMPHYPFSSTLDTRFTWKVFVHNSGEKWYMRYDPSSKGTEIPYSIARVIRAALWVQERHKRDPEDLIADYDYKYDPSGNLILSTNCHRTVLYNAGLIKATDENPESHQCIEYAFPLFGKTEYNKVASLEDVIIQLRDAVGASVGIVQLSIPGGVSPFDGSIAEIGDPNSLVHSFIVSFDTASKPICFEKIGSDDPFRICSLEDVYADYPEAFWAFKTFEDAKKSPEAQKISKILEESDFKFPVIKLQILPDWKPF